MNAHKWMGLLRLEPNMVAAMAAVTHIPLDVMSTMHKPYWCSVLSTPSLDLTARPKVATNNIYSAELTHHLYTTHGLGKHIGGIQTTTHFAHRDHPLLHQVLHPQESYFKMSYLADPLTVRHRLGDRRIHIQLDATTPT
jgi:hypothetical protein